MLWYCDWIHHHSPALNFFWCHNCNHYTPLFHTANILRRHLFSAFIIPSYSTYLYICLFLFLFAGTVQEKVAKRGSPVDNHSINPTLNYSPLMAPIQSPVTHPKGIAVPGALIILSYPNLSCYILTCHILSYSILSYPIMSYSIMSYSILFCPILYKTHILFDRIR